MANPPAIISPTLRTIVDRIHRHDFFFVNIGANDGVSNDIIFPFLNEYGWRGIVVEPLAPLFEELKRNYRSFGGIIFEHAAIAATPRPFYYIPAESGYERTWTRQVGTLNPEYLLKTINLQRVYEFNGPVPAGLEEAVQPVQVPCLTFEALMRKHGVDRVDFLNIDAESADYEIFCSIDFPRYEPSVMCIETSEMTDSQRIDFEQRLSRLDYVFVEQFDIFSRIYAKRALVPQPSRLATLGRRLSHRARRMLGRGT
jgi:FkbM family methyltransferase